MTNPSMQIPKQPVGRATHKDIFGPADNSLSESKSTPTLGGDLTFSAHSHESKYFSKVRQNALRNSKKLPLPFNDPSQLPKFISEDRKVLRFYAYFKEAVHESEVENYRIRKCVIYVHLEDDTWSIAEPKIENCGIPQGQFVKRGKIPKDSRGEFYGLDDIDVGAELTVYGRTFRVVDCDGYTREYMRSIGCDLQAPEPYPEDRYTRLREEFMRLETGADTTMSRGSKMSPMKKFMEARMGKFYSDVSLAQFLENDNKVLRFFCVWDDRERLSGDVHKYTVNLYLSDDTIEILEQHSKGSVPFPRMLNRARLPKNFKRMPKTGVSECPKELFYRAGDFRVGSIINVYNRQLLVLDADHFTRAYYDRYESRSGPQSLSLSALQNTLDCVST